MNKKLVIFTDLDGTLLDDDYSFEKAKGALEVLKRLRIPLVIVTSKTRAEIEVYRKRLGNKHPFISENGGGVFIPNGYFDDVNNGGGGKLMKRSKEKYTVIKLGCDYDKLVSALNKINEKIGVRGFSDMSVRDLVKDSGLNLSEARLAKKREYDEAFKLLNGKDEGKLIRMIRDEGLNYTKGGRYYHIMGENDKGRAVKILIDLYKKHFDGVFSLSFGDAKNDLPMLRATNKGFMIKGPKEWNKKVIDFLGFDEKFVREGEELYVKSVNVLKKLQLFNGAIYASDPKGRYPYVYPRDHAVCILGLIDAGEFERAWKGLEFVLKSQNKNGSFPQRLDKNGRDASYKPIQLDNTGLILYAFAKYVMASKDDVFLKGYKKRINLSINYISKQIHKKYLLFTPNSIHEFPPYENGLEVWVNAVCYGGLFELKKIGFKVGLDLARLKKSIVKYMWNGKFFVKNIRLRESSSVASDVDACSYALADYGMFEDSSEMIRKNVKVIERDLWHEKIGGLCRYKEYIGRNNGGWGPWPHFTLMVCRHYIRLGNRKKADKYLKWILKIADNGLLPEHIALKKDFEKWVKEYEKAGLMREDRKIMVKNIRKSRMYRKGLAYSVLPLAWPHAEFIRTWKLYREKFLFHPVS